MKISDDKKRIESKIYVKTYLDRLKYALKNDSVKISFQKDRKVDNCRNKRYTNRYTLGKLFPNEDEVEVLKRELISLKIDEYIETVKDLRFPKKSEMRVFGKNYINKDVYIKIRVELIDISNANGNTFILVMSFHFAERNFSEFDFPYRKN